MSDYEDRVRHDLGIIARSCVNHRPREMYGAGGGAGCAREVPIRAKAKAANGGSNFGIALRLPCDASPDPLFVCPWYEAVGIDRAAAEMAALKEAGARVLKKLARELSESK